MVRRAPRARFWVDYACAERPRHPPCARPRRLYKRFPELREVNYCGPGRRSDGLEAKGIPEWGGGEESWITDGHEGERMDTNFYHKKRIRHKTGN